MKIQLIQNTIALFLVLFTSLIVQSIGHIDFSVGNLLFLPIGATLYAYLCLGPRVLPGVVVANTIVGYFLWNNWFGNGIDGFIGHVVGGSFAPMVAILLVKYLQLNNFSIDNKLKYGPCLLLILLTAIINGLFKLFAFTYVLNESIDPIKFLGTYFVGDVLGLVVFMLIIAPIITPLLHKKELTNCWLSVP